MIDQYILQLSSPDPVIRRQAIIALGKSGDERALRPLANVIKTDPDPVLRELALRAGRHIRGLQAEAKLQSMAPAPSTPPPASPFVQAPSPFVEQPVEPPIEPPAAAAPAASKPPASPSFIQPEQASTSAMVETTPAFTFADLPAEPAAPTHKQPSKQDKELAKGRLEAAITYKLAGNTDRALESLVDAVRYDPDTASEAVALNLAANLTGITSPQDAMAEVTRQAQMLRVKRKSITGEAVSAVVDAKAVDTALEIVVLFVVTIAFVVVLGATLSRLLDNVIQNTPPNSRVDLRNPFRELGGPAILIFFAVIYSAVTTFLSVFGNVIVYVVGTFMGGAGNLFSVVRALVRVEIVVMIVFTVAFALMMLSVPVPPTRQGPTALFAVAGLLFIVSGLGGTIASVRAVARAHEVTYWRGLAILFVAGIAQSCIFGLLNFLVYSSQFQVPH